MRAAGGGGGYGAEEGVEEEVMGCWRWPAARDGLPERKMLSVHFMRSMIDSDELMIQGDRNKKNHGSDA